MLDELLFLLLVAFPFILPVLRLLLLPSFNIGVNVASNGRTCIDGCSTILNSWHNARSKVFRASSSGHSVVVVVVNCWLLKKKKTEECKQKKVSEGIYHQWNQRIIEIINTRCVTVFHLKRTFILICTTPPIAIWILIVFSRLLSTFLSTFKMI